MLVVFADRCEVNSLKIHNVFRRVFLRTISGYFRLLVLAMVAGTLLLFCVFTYFEITAARDFALRSFEQAVQTQSLMVDYWFTENARQIKLLSQLESMRRGKPQQGIAVFLQNNPNFSEITFINAAGINTVTGENAADYDYFKRGRRGYDGISDLVYSGSMEERILFSSPVYDMEGVFQGVVVGSMRLEQLSALVESFAIGETGHIHLRSLSGRIICAPAFEKNRVQMLDIWNTHTAKTAAQINSLSRNDGETMYSGLYSNERGVSVLGAYRGLKATDAWIVGGEIEEREILHPVYQKLVWIVLFSLGALSLLAFVIAAFQRRIRTPIASLLEQARKIEAGEYTTLPAHGFFDTAPQELQRIHEALDLMSRRLLADIEKLNRINSKLKEAEEMFRVVAENSMVGVYVIDENCDLVYLNPMVLEIIGCEPEDFVIGKSVLDFVYPEDRSLVCEQIKRRYEGAAKNLSYEVRLMHKDGHMLNIHVYSSMCMIEGKLLVIGTLIDITQQKVWEEAICESEKKNKAIIKAIPDALIRMDGSGIILEIIRTNESSLLINAATCIGRHLSLVWPAEIAARISQGLERCVATGELQLCEYDRAEGDKVVSKELRMVCYDENEVLLVIRDITERKEMEEILKHISCHDAMTGLYNRFYFEQQFRSSLVESMFPVGIIVADLDGLKLVNDSLGHAEGDKLLCKAARVLSVERKNSMTARIGGDEFIVLLTKTSLLELEEVYGEIEQNIIRCNHKEAGIPLYLSLGMDMGNYGEAIDEIFRRADDAMYWQKGKKRAETTASIQQAVAAAQSNMRKEDESE